MIKFNSNPSLLRINFCFIVISSFSPKNTITKRTSEIGPTSLQGTNIPSRMRSLLRGFTVYIFVVIFGTHWSGVNRDSTGHIHQNDAFFVVDLSDYYKDFDSLPYKPKDFFLKLCNEVNILTRSIVVQHK